MDAYFLFTGTISCRIPHVSAMSCSIFRGCFHHSAFLQGCRASDELHQLPGCMAVVQLECIHCVFPSCFHQLQHVFNVLPMFCPCFAHVLLCEGSVLDWPLDIQDLCLSWYWDCQIAQHCVASCELCICPGVMSTIHGWCPLSRKPCKDIWKSSACRQTSWLVCFLYVG